MLKWIYLTCFDCFFEQNSNDWWKMQIKNCCCNLSSYCTKMYPMAFMRMSPLSLPRPASATLPHVFSISGYPFKPNPILESHDWQSFSLLLTIPILALILAWTLKPSMLQCCCNDALGPISDFHVSRPREVLWYWPSAIKECKELALLWMITDLNRWSTFIPTQILENVVFQ